MDTSSELSHYSKGQRLLDISSILGFFVLLFINFKHLYVVGLSAHRGLLITGLLLGLVAADFVSGFVHWSADTWGTPSWPIVGPTLIRSFREHHVDPEAITRHDFFETNGNNCLVSLPVLFLLLYAPLKSQDLIYLFVVTSLSLTIWIFLTNQFHKWSHQLTTGPVVSFLQKRHFILSKDHHKSHHLAPFHQSYCITTGWLNPLLNATGFFRHAESLITFATGAQPRASDADILKKIKAG